MFVQILLAMGSPITWLLLAMAIGLLRDRQSKRSANAKGRPRRHFSTAAAGAAFQFMSIAYRPSHAFMLKAQIQQQEDTDEDEDGAPETPLKQLHRQLRRIRRGEPVDTLVWRLE